MPALLLIVGLVLLALAGCNVGAPRFAPGWWGVACVAAAFGWPLLTALG